MGIVNTGTGLVKSTLQGLGKLGATPVNQIPSAVGSGLTSVGSGIKSAAAGVKSAFAGEAASAGTAGAIGTGLTVAGLIAIATAGIYGTAGEVRSHDAVNAYNNLYNSLNNMGYDIDLRTLFNNLYVEGKLDSSKDYSKAINYIEALEKTDSNTNGLGWWEQVKLGLKTGWGTFLGGYSKEDIEAAEELIKEMTTYVPSLKIIDNYIKDNWDSIRSGVLSSYNMPAPDYQDTAFIGTRIPETPAYLMRGQEMADLYKMNYDPNYYYDLIKRGTEANVALAQYENEQAWNAAAQTDEAQRLSYLDSLRNTKSTAIAKGATEGSIAANEVLNNLNALGTAYSGYNDVAANNFKNATTPLLNNAQARITTDNYYNSLVNAIATDALLNYDSDVTRYGNEMMTNALLFTADQTLRGARTQANASMGSAYAAAQAQADNAKAAVNQYLDYVDRAIRGGYSVYDARSNLNKMAIAAETGGNYNNMYDYFLDYYNR